MEDTIVVDLTTTTPTPTPTPIAGGGRKAKAKPPKKELKVEERAAETRKLSACWLVVKGRKADAVAADVAKEQAELVLAL
jgi:hypothetical protein